MIELIIKAIVLLVVLVTAVLILIQVYALFPTNPVIAIVVALAALGITYKVALSTWRSFTRKK